MPNTEDEALAIVMRDSALVARADRVLRRVQDIVSASTAAAAMRAVLSMWRRERIDDRRRAIAIVLLVAAIVYGGSVLLSGEPQGWLWMIVPAAAVMGAGALWIFSSQVRSSDC